LNQKCHVFTSFVLELHHKPKSILSKTDFASKFPFFLNLILFFLAILKTYFTFDPQLPSRFTFLSEKILLKKIYAFLLSLKVMTDTKKHTLYNYDDKIFFKKSKKNILIIIKIIWMVGTYSIKIVNTQWK